MEVPVTDRNEIVASRDGVYGPVVESFVRMAQIWSGILNVEVQPWQIPLCMIGLKQVRATYAPDYSDNSDDIKGYIGIFEELIGTDMIHARSVNEYLEKKRGTNTEVPERECTCDTPYRYVDTCECGHVWEGSR